MCALRDVFNRYFCLTMEVIVHSDHFGWWDEHVVVTATTVVDVYYGVWRCSVFNCTLHNLQVRDYIHVVDLADGHIAALQKLFENSSTGHTSYLTWDFCTIYQLCSCRYSMSFFIVCFLAIEFYLVESFKFLYFLVAQYTLIIIIYLNCGLSFYISCRMWSIQPWNWKRNISVGDSSCLWEGFWEGIGRFDLTYTGERFWAVITRYSC